MLELLFILTVYLIIAQYCNLRRSILQIYDDIRSIIRTILITTAKGTGRLFGLIISLFIKSKQ